VNVCLHRTLQTNIRLDITVNLLVNILKICFNDI